MKGIILAGGAGSRLYPMTKIVTKQLQPIYDKPMIYYPLGLLMMIGIKEVLIITTMEDQPRFKTLLGEGQRFGINIQYEIQKTPKGISEAYIIGENFLNEDDSTLILGDNLFHGNFQGFRDTLKKQELKENEAKAHIFAYPVKDPERYGVVEFNRQNGKVISIEEKPTKPKSNFAIPGLYMLDKTAPMRAKEQKPSPRGDLEITDLIRTYLDEEALNVEVISRGMAWLDTGTPQSFFQANSYIAAIEQRQGFKVACLEEIALRMNFLSSDQYEKVIDQTPNGPYKDYLKEILKEIGS